MQKAHNARSIKICQQKKFLVGWLGYLAWLELLFRDNSIELEINYLCIYFSILCVIRDKMDDCNLKSLSIKSFQLTPAFKSDVLEYNVVVGSQIANITFSLETNDRSATYSIKVSARSFTMLGLPCT